MGRKGGVDVGSRNLCILEAMHINWEKPNLNQQVHHVNLTLTL